MASASGAASSSPGAPNVPQGSSDTQLIVVAELMLSASPELDSAEQGKLAAGALVHKLEVNTLSDGTERVLVGTVDHSKPLGWISAVSSTGTKSLKTAPPPRAAPAGTGGDGGTKSRNSTGTGGAKGSSGSSVGSKEWSAAVEACVLFDGHRSLAEQRFMFQSAKKIPTTEGAVLYAQGDFPSMLYLVHSGRYRATIRTGGASIIARDYGPADTFGACELLGTYGGRTCTVTVLAAGVVWGVPQRVVSEKLKIAPASSVPGLLAFCQQVSLFGCLSKERLVQFCRGARQRHLAAGEVLCSHGDAARSLYVVHSGYVHTSQPGSDFSLTMQPPQVFGESALFGESETRIRQATITAGEGGATVLTWSVAAVEALCGYELQQRSMALFTCKFLESVQVCGRLLASELSASQLETLATAVMEVATFADGDVRERPSHLPSTPPSHLHVCSRPGQPPQCRAAGAVRTYR